MKNQASTKSTKVNNDQPAKALSLMDMALEITKDQTTSNRSKTSINGMIHEILFEQKRKESKINLITEISLERLKLWAEDKDIELTTDNFKDEDIQKEYASITKTVKNGFETAVCAGSTSASYCSNKNYLEYELIKDGKGLYRIEKLDEPRTLNA